MTGRGEAPVEPVPSGSAATGLAVEAFDETTVGVDDLDRWSEVARSTLESEGVERGRLDLIFVDAETMAELNAEHMGHDRPTDVLAFPLDGGREAATVSAGLGDLPHHLGDVVICPQMARTQAPEHCGLYEAELSLLVVHGVLHVLGHDHAEHDERVVMQTRERHHLARYGFTHPELI
jgi:probable rRNA maturation factor